jgi:glutamyl-tRNA reductase
MKNRKDKPVFFIDLSVPRNIEEKIKDTKNVFLYNIDDLEDVIKQDFYKKKKEIDKAKKIIDFETDSFFNWLRSLNLTPTIESLKEKLENINKKELDSLKNKIPHEEFLKVSKYGDYITGKYIRLIIKNLKYLSKNGEKPVYTNLVNNLFELENIDEKNN